MKIRNINQQFNNAKKILKYEPQHIHALYRKCCSLKELNQHEQAIECIDKVLQCNQYYLIGYLMKGISLSNLNNYNDAIICYDQAIKIDPNYAAAYNNKGISLRNTNRCDDAIICYDRAIQIDPNYEAAYFNKGNSLDNLQKYKDAIICYKKATQIDPNYAVAYNNKGISQKIQVYYKLDTQSQLLQRFYSWLMKKLLKQIIYMQLPKIIKVLIFRYFFTRNLKKFNEAIACYDKAIEIDPNFVAAYNNKELILFIIIGISLIKMNKFQLAIKNYEQAIKFSKSNEGEFRKQILQIKNKNKK